MHDEVTASSGQQHQQHLVLRKALWLTNDIDDAKNESIGTEKGQVGSVFVANNRF